MVRNYQRKKPKPKYTKEDLEQAVEAVKTKTMGSLRASQRYNIPRSTIMDHLKGRRGIKSQTFGRPTALSKDAEEKLAECIKCMEKWGFGLSRKEILEVVGSYVSQNKIKNMPFKNGKPGEDWFLLFKKRHNLSIKKPEAVEYARKKNTDPFIIYEYFALLKKTLQDLDLFDKPSQIWNMDETGFCNDPSRVKVVGEKGANSTRITAGTGRSNTSVLFAAAADGSKAPPLIIFKGKNVWDSWIPEEGKDYPGTTYAATNNGWMESTVFKNYFIKTFIPHLTEQRPVLVLYDGHATHVDLGVIEAAINANITILKLPPHSSHLLQPLDLTVFRSVKLKWDELLVKWQRRNIGKTLNKSKLAELVGIVWNHIDSSVVQSGFRKGGIYPHNSNAVPREKFDPQALQRFEIKFPNGFNVDMHALIELEEERVPDAVINNINDPPAITEGHVELIDAAIESLASLTGALSSDVDHIELDSEVMEKNEGISHTNTNSIPVSSSDDPDIDTEIVAEDPEHSHIASAESQPLAIPTVNVNNVPVSTEIENDGEDLPSTSTNNVPQTADFQTLLLQFCKGSQKINEKVKRKRIAAGAEVITCEEVHQRLLNNPTCSTSRKKQKTSKDQKSTKKQSSVDVTSETLCGDYDTEEKENHTKNRKKGKFISKKKVGTPETTSSESEQSVQYEDESDLEISEAEDQTAEFSKNITDMEINDWVLVKFECQKSTCKYFIGRIESFEEGTNDPIIKFVKKKQAKQDNIAEPVFTWPPMEDLSVVSQNSPIMILPDPVVGRRGELKFNIGFTFSNYHNLY